MSRFLMLDREVSQPAGYADRGCLLVRYRLPLLRHCFVLCHEGGGRGDEGAAAGELLAFFVAEAARLAQESVGDPQAFMLLHSGASVRKRSNWHLHVFVIQHRWQKAWVHAVLAAKNTALACLGWWSVLSPLRRRVPAPAAQVATPRAPD